MTNKWQVSWSNPGQLGWLNKNRMFVGVLKMQDQKIEYQERTKAGKCRTENA